MSHPVGKRIGLAGACAGNDEQGARAEGPGHDGIAKSRRGALLGIEGGERVGGHGAIIARDCMFIQSIR